MVLPILQTSSTAKRPAVAITEPSSPVPRSTKDAPVPSNTLDPFSTYRTRSTSPTRSTRSRSPPARRSRSPTPRPVRPALRRMGPRLAPLVLPLPGESPVPGGNIGRPYLLARSGSSRPFSSCVTAAEELMLRDVVMDGPSPVNLALVARQMGRESPAYWAARIDELRAAWPATFQTVIKGRPGTELTEREEKAKKSLDKFFFK